MRKNVKWLWEYYKDYPGVILILMLLTPLQAAIEVIGPRLVGFSIDYLRTGSVADHVIARIVTGWGERFSIGPATSFGVCFIVLGAASFTVYGSFQSVRAWMNVRLEWLFRQKAFDRITTKGPDFFQRFRTGDLVTRMTDDVGEKLSWFACSGIFRLYEALMAILFITIMMASIDPWLTLWTAGPLPILVVIFFRSSSMLDHRYDHLQKRISRVNDTMEACFSGVRVVKAYVRESAQEKKFEAAARSRRASEIRSAKATAVIDSLYNSIWQFGVVIVLFAGGWKVAHGGLSLGEMATFIYYVVWLVFPMFDVGQFLVKSRQSAVSIGRLRELEDVPPLVRDEGLCGGNGEIKGHIRFENVSFTLPGADRNLIDNVTLAIEPGETVAFVGRIGSGKSWLANMVPRLVDPGSGRITLDGKDLREYELGALRGAIGFVPQDPILFSESIRRNIELGRESFDDERLAWALDVSQFLSEVDAFPNRIDTEVGTRGMAISGGQKQRLALARALAGRPKILILDDCTSALDARTESRLWEKLHEAMPGTTSILITHRPDTLRRADQIFVLVDGRIVESGHHRDLIARKGEYAQIYHQYELEELIG